MSQAVCLVGLRGAGKSTVGARVADALGRPFVDLDLAIEGRAGETIRSLFAGRGEDAFRDLEAEALRETLRLVPNVVVATGGGVILRAENRAILAKARVIYLHGAAAVLASRVVADPSSGESRPALAPGGPEAEATLLAAERDSHYRELAEAVVDADPPLDEVVEAVLAILR